MNVDHALMNLPTLPFAVSLFFHVNGIRFCVFDFLKIYIFGCICGNQENMDVVVPIIFGRLDFSGVTITPKVSNANKINFNQN